MFPGINTRFSLALFAALALSGCGGRSNAKPVSIPLSQHIFVIAEENRSYEQIVGNPNLPYLNSLFPQAAIASQYYSIVPGSLDSWMWLTAGQFVTATPAQAGACFNVDNIVRSILGAGLSWKAYNESLPFAGDPVLAAGAYLRAHNPLSNYSDSCAPDQSKNSAPFTGFASDVRGTMANFVFLDPNLLHDMHTGSDQQADRWLSQTVPEILARSEFGSGGDGQLWVMFDEGELKGISGGTFTDTRCSSAQNGCGGRLLLAVIGPQVKKGSMSTTLYHQVNVLKTWSQALRINAPNGASTANAMADMFQ